MKDHDLLETVGGINEKYNSNAGRIKKRRNKFSYVKWIAVAACLCVIVGGIVYMNNIGINTGSPDAGNSVDGTVIPGDDTSDEIDPVMRSIAVFPSTESVGNVTNATLTEIPKERLVSKNSEEALELNSETVPEHLIRYLPDKLPDGYELESAMLYETTMNSGTKYYMVRVTYITPGSDRDVEDVLEEFTIFVMNFRPDAEKYIYTVDNFSETILDGSTFYISVDNVYVGFSDVVLTLEEFQTVLKSMKIEIKVEEARKAGNRDEKYKDSLKNVWYETHYYPIYLGNPEWGKHSMKEEFDVNNPPLDLLFSMSSDELATLLFESPYLNQMLTYFGEDGHIAYSTMFGFLELHSDIFYELLRREDGIMAILEHYQNSGIDIQWFEDETYDSLDKKWLAEVFGSQFIRSYSVIFTKEETDLAKQIISEKNNVYLNTKKANQEYFNVSDIEYHDGNRSGDVRVMYMAQDEISERENDFKNT